MPPKTTDRAATLASRVCEARDEAGLNNSSLARATGLPRKTIVRAATGRNEPRVAALEKIAEATGKPLDFFRAESATPASERVRQAAQDLAEALLDELREKLEVPA